MNYQLCLHVWEKFGLNENQHDMPKRYAEDNHVSNFKIRTFSGNVVIDDIERQGYFFISNAHTKEQAEEILEYTKEVEILFV